MNIIFFVVFIQIAFAQITPVALQNYKTPNYKAQGLYLSPNISGATNNTSNSKTLSSHNFNVDLNYFCEKNTRKNILDIYASSVNTLSTQKDKASEKYLHEQIQLNSSWYKNTKLHFDYGIDASTLNIYNQDFGSTDFHLHSLSIPLGVGFGRIENLNELERATWMLHDLKENGSLSNVSYTDEDASFLADQIIIRKKKRIFDSRKKLIENIEFLNAALKERNLYNSDNAKALTTIYDNYNQFDATFYYIPFITYTFLSNNSYTLFSNYVFDQRRFKYIRGSGHNVELQITPGVSSVKPNSAYQTNSQYLNTALVFQNQKPLSLKWQFDYELKTSFNFNKNNYVKPNELASKDLFIIPEGAVQLSYHPNTRTQIVANTSAAHFTHKYIDSPSENSNTTIFSVNLGMHYFINYRTTIQAGISNYLVNTPKYNSVPRYNKNEFNYTVRFVHYFF